MTTPKKSPESSPKTNPLAITSSSRWSNWMAAAKHGHSQHSQQMELLQNASNAHRGGGNETCGVAPSFVSGSVPGMSPDPNTLLHAGAQHNKTLAAQSALDSVHGWPSPPPSTLVKKQSGGKSALGSFMENLNNMKGGRLRRVYRSRSRKRSSTKRRKKRRRRKTRKYPRLGGYRKHMFYKNKRSRGKRVTVRIIRKYPKLFSKTVRKRYGIRH